MKSNNHLLNESIEQTISSELIYKGKSFSFFTDTVRFWDDRIIKRDYVNYPEAVVILAFLDNEKVILERQYRYPVKKLLYELPAGKIDNFEETKIEAAQRELLEETGYKASNLEYLISYFPAVGYSTERIHVFKATELIKEKQLLDEDEVIEIEIFSIDDCLKMIRKNEIEDAKTILSILYYNTFYR
ncbi:MAG: NUDIX hydrolase [Brevinematia bacterium]